MIVRSGRDSYPIQALEIQTSIEEENDAHLCLSLCFMCLICHEDGHLCILYINRTMDCADSNFLMIEIPLYHNFP